MMYTKILKPENRELIKALTIAVLAAFLVTISSCRTYYDGIYTAAEYDTLSNKEEHSILELDLRDTVITNDDFYLSYIDSLSSFQVQKKQTSFLYKPLPSKYEMFQKMAQLKLSDVYKIKTEYSEANTGATLLIISAVLVVIGAYLYKETSKMSFFGTH